MKSKIFISRDTYGQVLQASFQPDQIKGTFPLRHRYVTSTKSLAQAMLQTGTSDALFNAAWKLAVWEGAVDPAHQFRTGDPLDVQTVMTAQAEADQVDAYISRMVNNPRSKFYIYG